MVRLTTFIALALLLCQAASSSHISVKDPRHDQISKVTSFIAGQIESNWMYSGSYVRLFPFCKQTDPVFERLMRGLSHAANPPTLWIGDQDFSYPLQTVIQKSTFNLMLVGSWESLTQDLLPKLQAHRAQAFTHSTIWRLQAPTFVVLTGAVHFVREEFELIFERFTSLNMYNTAIIFWTTTTKRHQIVTHNPFREPRLEDKTGVTTFMEIFYDKYANLHGHVLRVTQFDEPTRSVVYNKTYLSGTDGKALVQLCKQLNATYRVVGPQGPQELAETNADMDLHHGIADVNFNMRLFLSLDFLTSMSVPTYIEDIDSIYVLVPKAGLYPPFQNLLHPIEPKSRFVLAAIFMLVAIIWYLFLRYCRNTRPNPTDVLMDTLRLQLATSLPRNIVNVHERFLICGFMVYGFIVISGYQTLLISFLTSSPRSQPDIRSFVELNRTNMDVYAPNWIFKWRESNFEIPLSNRILETNITVWDLKNSRLAGTKFGFIAPTKVVVAFLPSSANKLNGRPLMHRIGKRLLRSPSSYRMARNSPYEMVVPDWISRFRESGLYRKFKSDSADEAKRDKTLKSKGSTIPVAKPKGKEKTGVRFSEIEPAFLLLGFGCVVAGVVFILELTYSKITKASNQMFVWRVNACSHCGVPKLVRRDQPTEAV